MTPQSDEKSAKSGPVHKQIVSTTGSPKSRRRRPRVLFVRPPLGVWGTGGCPREHGGFNCREYLASPTVFLEAFAKRNPKTMPDGQVAKQIVSTIGSPKGSPKN